MPVWNNDALHYYTESELSIWWAVDGTLLALRPQAYYPLTPHGGIDFSGNGYHLTSYGTTAYSTAAPPHLSLSGLSATPARLQSDTIPIRTGYTVGCWLKAYSTAPIPGEDTGIISRWRSTTANPIGKSFAIYMQEDELKAIVSPNNTTNSFASFNLTAAELLDWHHVALANGRLYADGVFDKALAYETLFETLESPFQIGAYNSTVAPEIRTFDGQISRAFVFDRALPERDIRAIYNAQKTYYQN